MQAKWTVRKRADGGWTVLTPSGITRAFGSWVGAWAYAWVRADISRVTLREVI